MSWAVRYACMPYHSLLLTWQATRTCFLSFFSNYYFMRPNYLWIVKTITSQSAHLDLKYWQQASLQHSAPERINSLKDSIETNEMYTIQRETDKLFISLNFHLFVNDEHEWTITNHNAKEDDYKFRKSSGVHASYQSRDLKMAASDILMPSELIDRLHLCHFRCYGLRYYSHIMRCYDLKIAVYLFMGRSALALWRHDMRQDTALS